MPLTDDEIVAIAKWQPIREGFGRDDSRTGMRIQGILDQINASGEFRCKLIADDGLSNYFALFAYHVADQRAFSRAGQVDGLLVYLSACAPVGVVGCSQRISTRALTSHYPFEIDALISPDQFRSPREQNVLNAIRSGGYEVLSRDEVSKPLPPGVKPDEYCYSSEPWDRVFHALFATTD
jgi:hypothetical protein